MKVYEAVFKEGQTEGVYALSVVENPAMEDYWIKLSEQAEVIELAEVDGEKRLLLGAALIPNKKIYRNIDGNEFYITFSEETIEKLSHEFMKNQYNNNSSLEHETKLGGMSVVESWIVQNPNQDKSNNYGKVYEKGTWVAMMKVDNDNVWKDVQQGKIKGFSIDALLGLQEINLKSITMNDDAKKSLKDDILDGIKALFNSQKEENVEKEEVENIEVQPEAVEEVEATSDRDFDVEAFKADIMETVSAHFSEQLTAKEDEMKKALEAKDKELETLKAELNAQPEAETVVVSPEATNSGKIEVKYNGFKTTKDTVFENLANNLWNN